MPPAVENFLLSITGGSPRIYFKKLIIQTALVRSDRSNQVQPSAKRRTCSDCPSLETATIGVKRQKWTTETTKQKMASKATMAPNASSAFSTIDVYALPQLIIVLASLTTSKFGTRLFWIVQNVTLLIQISWAFNTGQRSLWSILQALYYLIEIHDYTYQSCIEAKFLVSIQTCGIPFCPDPLQPEQLGIELLIGLKAPGAVRMRRPLRLGGISCVLKYIFLKIALSRPLFVHLRPFHITRVLNIQAKRKKDFNEAFQFNAWLQIVGSETKYGSF